MLTLLVPLLAVVSPSPVPSAVAPPSALKEIGHVESLSVCSAIVVHANSAIGVALDNDQNLALTINRLRTTDLDDDNEIKRRNGMNDLTTLTGRIRVAAASGAGEIKRLRAMAAQTAEPTRKAELKAFADALSGAITRQRKAAEDLDKTITIIDGRRAVEAIDTPELTSEREAISDSSQASAVHDADGRDRVDTGIMRNPAAPTTPSRVNDILRAMADEFVTRTQAILADEGVAADHSLGATTGC
jgi:hypothetical protein